jgi:predicted acyl esterase
MRGVRLVVAVALAVALLGAMPATAGAPDCTTPDGGWDVSIERAVTIENRFGEAIAVDLHRPVAPEGCRFPVVLESSAYRDWMAPGAVDAIAGEDARRAWWVQRGYVYAFADVPGTGASEGEWCLLCRNEQLSGVDMVEALGTAPWSNGNVGMIGGSYPGITALLVAQHRPKHLRALIVAEATGDLYDDFLYPGGMRRGEDVLAVAGAFTYIDAASGSANDLFLRMQADHPTDDDWYAERRLDPSSIKVPTYLLGGWNDIFDRAVWNLYDDLGSSVKVLRHGPFTHVPVMPQANAWPCEGHESSFCGAPLFDRFLRGVTTASYRDLAARPVQLYVEPNGASAEQPYLALERKPRTVPWTMTLGAPGATAVVIADPTAGATGGRWFARGSVPGTYQPFDHVLGVDGPADQRVEEAKLVSIASPVLGHDTTILGGGTLSLLVRSNAPDADIAVRIIDEWPVGSPTHPHGYAYRVGHGWLKASHRNGHTADRIAPLMPGEWTRVEVDLWPIGYRFAAGHRIRIDIAGADVPRFFPPDAPFELTVDLGSSTVVLPELRA